MPPTTSQDPQTVQLKSWHAFEVEAEVPSATGLCAARPDSQTSFYFWPFSFATSSPWPAQPQYDPPLLPLLSAFCLLYPACVSAPGESAWVDSLSVGRDLVWSRGCMTASNAVWAPVPVLFGVQILSLPSSACCCSFLPGLQLTSQVGEVIGNLVPAYILFSIRLRYYRDKLIIHPQWAIHTKLQEESHCERGCAIVCAQEEARFSLPGHIMNPGWPISAKFLLSWAHRGSQLEVNICITAN